MTDAPVITETDFVDRRGHKGPERRCLATGETRLKSDMIRFVRAPDGTVTPDIAEKLPGRGVWVSAAKADLDTVIQKKLFARGFKKAVSVPDDLVKLTTDLLSKRVLGLITMALKSGQLRLGFDQVKSAAQSEYLAWRIEASDGAEAGRGKIRVLTKAISRELGQPSTPVIGCFSSETLGKAIGRDHITHAAIPPGPLARSMQQAVRRLSGFIPLIPKAWPDYSHETGQKSAGNSRIDS